MNKPEFIQVGEGQWFRGGSREIVNPPPTDTDEDWFVYSRWGGMAVEAVQKRLAELGAAV